MMKFNYNRNFGISTLLLIAMLFSCNRYKTERNLGYRLIYEECSKYADVLPEDLGVETEACVCLAKVVSKEFAERLSYNYIKNMNNAELKLQILTATKDDKARNKLIRCYGIEFGLTDRQSENVISFLDLIW